MTQPSPYAVRPARRGREGVWLADLVAGWILVGLLTIATIVLDLFQVYLGLFFLMCADDGSGDSCRGWSDFVGHVMGTLGLAWLPVLAAISGIVTLGRRRVPVCWIPLVAAGLVVAILVVGARTLPT